MIDLSTEEVPAPTETGKGVILDSDIILDSDGKIRMQYVVSDTDPDVGDGTQGTMGVNLTASNKGEGCGTGIP